MPDSNSKPQPESSPTISISPKSDDSVVGWAEESLRSDEEPEGQDADGNPYERATVAPPMPQQEYVARMMGEAPASPPPPSTPASPFPAEPPTARLRVPPEPAEEGPRGSLHLPLTLDFTESAPPLDPSREMRTAPPDDPFLAELSVAAVAPSTGDLTHPALDPQPLPGVALHAPTDDTESLPPASTEPPPNDFALEIAGKTGSPLSLANALQGPPSTRRMGTAELAGVLHTASVSSQPATLPQPAAQALSLAARIAVTQPSASYEDHSDRPQGDFVRPPHLEGWRAPAMPAYPVADAATPPSDAEGPEQPLDADRASLAPLDRAPQRESESERARKRAREKESARASERERERVSARASERERESECFGGLPVKDALATSDPDLPTKSNSPRLREPRSQPASSLQATQAPPLSTRRRSLPPSPSFGQAHGDALELVAVRATSSIPPSQVVDMVRARDRFDVGDFSGALTLAEALLEADPDDADALLLAEHCRDVLRQMCLSRLGGLGCVPQVMMAAEQLRWLSLDHRTGFVLSLVDGRSTVDELLDMSGMRDLDALRILVDLVQQKVIRTA